MAEPGFDLEDSVTIDGPATVQQSPQGDAGNLSRQVQDTRIKQAQAGNQPPTQFNDQYYDIRTQQRRELREMARDRWNTFENVGKIAAGSFFAYTVGPRSLAPTVPAGAANRAALVRAARNTGMARALGPLALGWGGGYLTDRLIFSKDQTMEWTIAGDVAGIGIALAPGNWRWKAAAIFGTHVVGKIFDHFRQPKYEDDPRKERQSRDGNRQQESQKGPQGAGPAREQARQDGEESIGAPNPLPQQGDGRLHPVQQGDRRQQVGDGQPVQTTLPSQRREREVDPRQQAIDEAHRQANRDRQNQNIARRQGTDAGAGNYDVPPWQNPYLKAAGVEMPKVTGTPAPVDTTPRLSPVPVEIQQQTPAPSKFSQRRQTYAPQ